MEAAPTCGVVTSAVVAETDGELETIGVMGKGPFAAWHAGTESGVGSFKAFGGPAAMDQFLEAVRCAAVPSANQVGI